ncbi:MAG TPA: hydroxyacylglutathione hydrolase [Deltaproteobacteria bacterium]|nr:hydroxyacylglutathione hydrolase [Deltaproteobacteria bacterium]
MSLEIAVIPCLRDNYAFLLHDRATGATAVVDTPEVGPINAALEARGWHLTHILNTHHHPDHVGGNRMLCDTHGCQIIGPASDAHRIPGLHEGVGEGDAVMLGQIQAVVWDTPAHTSGHISYYFAEASALFVGDTLFAVGCGRLFEGTALQMWSAMHRYRSLPDHTRVYCAHEYTASNIRFARSIDPSNEALARRAQEVEQLRAADQFTVPTTIAQEKATNPFMRADDPMLAAAVQRSGASPADVLGEIRRRKDRF